MTESAIKPEKHRFPRWKKILLSVLVVFIVLMAGLRMYLTPILRTTVSEVSSKVLGVPVSLGNISIWTLLGRVEIDDLKIGNPKGFHAPQILVLQHATVDISPISLLSEKLRIEEITVRGLELFYEQTFNNNNISALKAQVEANTGTGTKSAEVKPEAKNKQTSDSKKLQLDLLALHDNRIHFVVMKQAVTMPLPPVDLKNIGTGPEGITGAEVFEAVLDQLLLGALSTIKEATAKYGASALNTLQDAGDKTLQNLKEKGENIGNQFKELFRSK